MKKTRKLQVLFLMFFGMFIFTNNINAFYTNQGQNLSNDKITSQYNQDTGELEVYGINKYGALGTSDNLDVSEVNKVKINDKINNEVITDYFISEVNIYVLTKENKVYASGLNLATGYDNESTTFVEIDFYNQENNTITDMDGELEKGITNYSDFKYKITFNIDSNTNYIINKFTDPIYSCFITYYPLETIYERQYVLNEYPLYSKTNADKSINFIQVDQDDEIIYNLVEKNENEVYVKLYTDNVLTETKYENNKVYKSTRYSNNKVISNYIMNQRPITQGAYKNILVPSNSHYYTYKNGYIIDYKGYSYIIKNNDVANITSIHTQRIKYHRDKNNKYIGYTQYKFNNYKKPTLYLKYLKNNNSIYKRKTIYTYNKSNLTSKTSYVYNKKGELKSNKYGNAYRNYKKYSKNKVTYSKTKYYNSKGKLK